MKPARHRRRSLLAALYFRVAILLVAVIVSVGVIAYFTAQDRVNDIYDGQLVIGASVLRALMTDEIREADGRGQQLAVDDSGILSPEDRKAFDDYAEWRMFRIWRGDVLLLRSDTGPRPVPPHRGEGFSEVGAPDQARWRLYTLRVPGHDVSVQVGERTDIRGVLLRSIALGTMIPLLLLVPLIAGLLWFSLRDGLGALRLLMSELGSRGMRDLSTLSPEPWPRDLHPLIRSINRLIRRINRAVQRERRFLDSAAHQLRTPLASIKLQTQLIAGGDDPQERAALSRGLTNSVDRAVAMTDSLLTLARLEARAAAPPALSGDLREEVVAALADLAPAAARAGVELSFDGAEAAPCGDPILVRLIAANLIENALNHSPPHGEIDVSVEPSPAGFRLTVQDCGPGIPPHERSRVVHRFFRGQSASPQGSGLGLSIVAEAVRVLNGRLALRDRADGRPGLCVTVDLPVTNVS